MRANLISKRKIIDIPEDCFRSLSIIAASEGLNLKNYIEKILEDEAKTLKEDRYILELLKDPDANQPLIAEQKAEFEKWLDQ